MEGYRHWLATLVDDRKNATSPGMWLGTGALVLVVLVLASFIQPVAGWFQLRFWPSLVCFLPCFVLGTVAGSLEQRGRLSLRAYGVLVLVGNAALQLFFGALIAFSRPPGSFALASLFVLTLAFHGYMTRATLAYPYPLVGSFAAMAGAIALNPDEATWTVFAFVGPTSILVALLTGQAGLREHRDRRERESLRQAIYYRELNEKARAHSKMTERVVDLLRYNHDAGNILSTIFVNAQLLEEQLERSTTASPPVSLRPIVSRLIEQLVRLKSLINQAHQFSEDPVMTAVPLRDVLRGAAAECRALYPGVVIDMAELGGSASVLVHDGEMGLRRIVENLLHNACEGNGVTAALHVRVEAHVDGEQVRLRFEDDGPGFGAEQLEGPPSPFRTTKPRGHGLGLFSVTQLVQASGGRLRCANRKGGGGAAVEVRLARALDAANEAAEESAAARDLPSDPPEPSGAKVRAALPSIAVVQARALVAEDEKGTPS